MAVTEFFLNKVAEVIAKTAPIKVEKMSIPEVVLSLRDTGWCDVPRGSEVIYEELKMKGVPGVEPRPTMMALLRLVRKMKRFKKEGKYYYIAPWLKFRKLLKRRLTTIEFSID